jgi:hypothetical protein
MPGLVVLVILVILAFLAFVFLPPFLRAAGMAAIRLCASGVAALVAVVAFGTGDVGPDHHRACCERAREARDPGNGHQLCHLLAPYWCRSASEIYFAVVVICKMPKAVPMNAR